MSRDFGITLVMIWLVYEAVAIDSQYTVSPNSCAVLSAASLLGDYKVTDKGFCATLCTVDNNCKAAFFSKSQSKCSLYDSYGESWISSSDWDALIKIASIGSSVSDQYKVAMGAAYTASGQRLASKYWFPTVRSDSQCQQLCESASPACSLFSLSTATHQCLIPDTKTAASEISASTDIYIKTYYKFTTVSMKTTGDYSQQIVATFSYNVSWITFSVQACQDAFLTLQPNGSGITTNAYEFVFGVNFNTVSTIRRTLRGADMVYVAGAFLDCNSARQMWVSWTGGLLRFATGNVVGNATAYSYQDPALYKISAIGISGGIGSMSSWVINVPIWI